MSLRIGTQQNISRLYVGTDQVQRAYLGSEKVWESAQLDDATEATSVTHNGVTITWTESTAVGEYADGTPWILGPVTITAKVPAGSTTWSGTANNGSGISGRTVNGMMRNPGNRSYAGGNTGANRTGSGQGFDSFTPANGVNQRYEASLNIDPTLPGAQPVTVAEGTVVIANSLDNPDAPEGYGVVGSYALFTIVPSIPLAGSIRPPQSVAKSHW